MTSPDPVPAPAGPVTAIVTTEGRTLLATEVTGQAAVEPAATLPVLVVVVVEFVDAIAAPMNPPPTPTTAKAGIRIHGHHGTRLERWRCISPAFPRWSSAPWQSLPGSHACGHACPPGMRARRYGASVPPATAACLTRRG